MEGDWREYTVEEIAAPTANALATGPFGSSISSKYFQDSGVPVIRGSNLSTETGTRLLDDEPVFISEAKASEFERSTVRNGDLVFTCWGTINQVGLICSRSKYREYVISNKQMKLTPDPQKADSLFLYYLFSGPEKQAYILSNGIGSSVPGFNLSQLRAHVVSLPPLDEQRRIAAVLGALDDRIELNRRMNRTLEAMAQALFRARFVTFEGRDDLVDSGTDLGLVPEGWQVGSLEQIAMLHRDLVQPSEVDSASLYIGLGDMPRGSIALDTWGQPEDVTSVKHRFAQRDLLFGKLRPYFKKVGVAPQAGICSSDIYVIRPVEPHWYAFVLGVLTFDPFIRYTESVSTGTRMPRVGWEAMARYELVLPPSGAAVDFNKQVAPLVERILANVAHNRTLAALRDTLLPKLISGEVRVPEVEKLTETVL